jgi:hypothetical protein
VAKLRSTERTATTLEEAKCYQEQDRETPCHEYFSLTQLSIGHLE